MPVNITGSRPLATTTESLAIVLQAESPVENDTDNTISYRVSRDNINAPSFTLSIGTTNGQPTITAVDLSKVRPGDSIASSNITGTVTAVNTTAVPNTATVNASATGTGTVTATFDPPAFDVALYDIKATHTISGSTVAVSLKVYQHDGKSANDANGDGKDDVAATAGSLVGEAHLNINLDQFLINARVPRT